MTRLTFSRVFSHSDLSPYDEIRWSEREATITDESGAVIFSQKVEAPASWSDLAVKVVASKYFRGDGTLPADTPINLGGRERSVRQLISRVVDAIVRSGIEQGYFAPDSDDAKIFGDELAWICLNQYASFNSPVWFNVGLDSYGITSESEGWVYDRVENRPVRCRDACSHPQSSACFIQSVDDNMASIMALATSEAMLFKNGSGSGTDLSTLRSSREKLSGGGKPSGPVSFMRLYDGVASVIKSGGRNRRSAKMQTLHVSHPDIMEFIRAKSREDEKARILVDGGIPGGLNGEASETVCYQNCNMSVRVSDAFMLADERDEMWSTVAVTTGSSDGMPTYRARDILRGIAEGTWRCGDPGMQFDDTINFWHTSLGSGRIYSSNPCAEFLDVNETACNLASINLMKFRTSEGFDCERFRAACRLLITAQDILVDLSSYPTEPICRNSHELRPLGLGYCGLGALAMSFGHPYDSDGARSLAAEITSVMTAESYLQSAIIAAVMGPFAQYERNRDSMDRVIYQHATSPILGHSLHLAEITWIEAIELRTRYGYRNDKVTLLAPTGCATPETLVLTDAGLKRLGRLGDKNGSQWQDTKFNVQTDEGPKQVTKFYINGLAPVINAETDRGYRFRATPIHQLKVIDRNNRWVWRRMDALSEGDILPLKLGGMIGDPVIVELPSIGYLDPRSSMMVAPRTMMRDLAELVGAFMANGSTHEKGLRISVFRDDVSLIERTVSLFLEIFGLRADVVDDSDKVVAVTVNSVPLRRWWQDAGFAKIKPTEDHSGKGYESHIPDSILETNDPMIYAAFLRGVIDHDGTVAEGCPEFMNKSREFVADLKVMALALGFPTTLRYTISGISGKPLWRARLLNREYVSRWSELIGFTESRKSDILCGHVSSSARNDIIPVPRSVFDRVCPVGHPDRSAGMMATRRSRGITRTMAQRIYRETKDSELLHYLGFFYDKIESATLEEEIQPTYDLSVPENVTWTGGGFISHNTIAFMMDSGDSTGIEPFLSVVQYKTLSGGGFLKIVNTMVPQVLTTLGYDDADIDQITRHIETYDTIEDVIFDDGSVDESGLRPDHLAIFDASFPPKPGVTESGIPFRPREGRFLSMAAHIGMMAAAQPFLSGAISKTVNAPNSATVEDIEDAYRLAWKSGLKAIAIFRDGSKESQPVQTGKANPSDSDRSVLDWTKDEEFSDRGVYGQLINILAEYATDEGAVVTLQQIIAERDIAVAERDIAISGKKYLQTLLDSTAKLQNSGSSDIPERRRLGDNVPTIRHKFSIDGYEGYLHVGLYPEGQPAEIFVTMAKEGSTLGGLMDAWATSISLMLQYGIPLSVIEEKFSNANFSPSGFTKNPELIPRASSPTDYIVRWLRIEFDPTYRAENLPRNGKTAPIPLAESFMRQVAQADPDEVPDDRLAIPSETSVAVATTTTIQRQPGPPCRTCGHFTTPNGANCWVCQFCGSTSGGCGG